MIVIRNVFHLKFGKRRWWSPGTGRSSPSWSRRRKATARQKPGSSLALLDEQMIGV